jgi:acetyl esterase/lipase
MQQLEAILQASSTAPPPASPDPLAWRGWWEAINEATPQAMGTQVEAVDTGGNWKAERISAPGSDPERLIIYYHGGGFLFGSSRSHRVITTHLAQQAAATVLSVDYRLAPEHPAPAAHDDCFDAYLWALDQGYQASSIALAGDSAGGNLALCTAIRARDEEGLPLPACVATMSAALDFASEGESHQVAEPPPLVNRELVGLFNSLYMPDGNVRSASVTPFYDSDLAGLMPVMLHVGDWELLRDDSVTIAQRMRDAGVDVELKVWPGMVHCWQLFAPMLDEGMQSLREISAFITRHCASS